MNDIVSGHDTSYWYAQTPDEVLRTINTSQQGLSQHEAKNRLDRYGLNSVKKGKETSIWQILRHQITSPLIYVLLAALGITLAIDQRSDAIVIETSIYQLRGIDEQFVGADAETFRQPVQRPRLRFLRAAQNRPERAVV